MTPIYPKILKGKGSYITRVRFKHEGKYYLTIVRRDYPNESPDTDADFNNLCLITMLFHKPNFEVEKRMKEENPGYSMYQLDEDQTDFYDKNFLIFNGQKTTPNEI